MTAIIFIIVLSVIVFVHELGHFVMAKRAGMKVEEFGFGFPPRAFGFKPKNSDTTYSLNWIPFGGFVKIRGEDDNELNDAGSFRSASFPAKVSVLVAGVFMNIILATVLFTIINVVGYRVPIDEFSSSLRASDVAVDIVRISENSPAKMAGVMTGDRIVGYETVADFQKFVAQNAGSSIDLVLLRNENEIKVSLIPRKDPPSGEGALGIALVKMGFVRYPWYEAGWRGIEDTWFGLKAIFFGFIGIIWNLVSTGKAGADVAGPLGIAVFAGQAARSGFATLFQFVALISINLAVINIVPFPALDGGRLFFLIIEKIKGSPIPKKIEARLNSIGFILLLLLMLYITVRDVTKFFA